MTLPILKDYNDLILKEILLTESFKIKSIDYGSDLYNKTFIHENRYIYAFFKFEDKFVLVLYNDNDGEFGYGLCDKFSYNFSDYIDEPDLGFTTTKFLSLLNSLFFVMNELTKSNSDIIYLYIRIPKKQKLNEFYEIVFNNSSFLRTLGDMNFSYQKMKSGFEFMKRKV